MARTSAYDNIRRLSCDMEMTALSQNAVYHGSPKNVRFRAATITTSMSALRRKQEVRLAQRKQTGGSRLMSDIQPFRLFA